MMRTVFERLKGQGLVTSEREFSTRWLGRAADYACDSRFRKCSPATSIQLAQRLIAADQRELASLVMVSLLDPPR